MADSVNKLKQLLFQQETATLVELESRIARVAEAEERARAQIVDNLRQLEAIRELGAESRRLQEEVEQRLAELDRIAGTPDALKASVARVIDGVLLEGRKSKGDEISRALAPMLSKIIAAEINNNRDQMIEALYPITGALVKAYVASEMRALVRRMNRGIQTTGLMLRVRSWLSPYTKTELELAETQRLEIEELYLLRRGSGELLTRFPESLGGADDAQQMSSVLAAITEFATHAFRAESGQLRSFDAGGFTVFLRASPVYILAAKCRGVAAPGVEGLLDGAFMASLPLLHETDQGGLRSTVPTRILAELKTRMEDGIAQRHVELERAGLPFDPLRALVAICMLLMVAGGGWWAWTSWEERQTRETAQRTIAASEAMRGYPVNLLEVGSRGRTIAVSGLAPSEEARSVLMGELKAALKDVEILDRGLAVLPGSPPDVTPQIQSVRRDVGTVREAVRRDIDGVEAAVRRDMAALERQQVRAAAARSLQRARARLEEALPDIGTLAGLQSSQRRAQVATVHKVVETAVAGIEAQTAALSRGSGDPAQDGRIAEALAASIAQLRKAALELSALIGERPPAARSPPPARRAGEDLSDVAEAASLAAERLATVTAAALQAASIPIPEPPRIAPPSALERLSAYVARHAVFFANNEDYRDEAAAERVIEEVARLAREAGVVIRVIGYTDERGGQARNNQLAQARAERVAQALAARGLPRSRIVTVGRGTGPDLSASIGPDSPNRRVELAIGFEGEPGSGP